MGARSRSSFWRFRIATVTGLIGLVAAACGSGQDEQSTGDTTGGDASEDAGGQETTEEAPALAEVQELVVGYAADPWLDSEEDRKAFPSYPLNADVCETLVRLTEDFQLAPGLASDWELTGDNTFTFTLRDDVTFSDGTPLTAADVQSTFDYYLEEPDSTGNSFIGPDSVQVVDDQSVEITPTAPNLRLVEQINHPSDAILAPGSDPLNDPNVGCTGPFQVVSYTPEEELVVERNENYWGEPALLDRITFRFLADDTTRTLALQNGEVDLITGVPRSIVSTLEGVPGIELVNAPPGQVLLMYVSQRDAAGSDRILADPLVRRAVAASIDREEYVDGVLDGNAEVVTTVNPPEVLGEFADLVEGVPYDPEEAAELLDEAGWTEGSDGVREKDGRPLQLSMVYSPGGGGTGIDLGTMEFIQAQLREVGIDGVIEQLDAGGYRDALDTGNYDLDVSGPNQNDANPAFLLSLRWFSQASGLNAQWVSPGPDTDFEALINESQQETDPTELQRLAAEAMHELVDVEVAGIPLAGTYRIYAMQDDVEGFEPHPSSTNQRWSTVYIGE